MKRRTPLLLLVVAMLPACGHRGDPLPPRRKTPPMPVYLRLAQRGEAIELQARAPAASVDGVPYESLSMEFLYGTGEVDLEKAGTHLLVRAAAGGLAVHSLALPAPETLVRASVRAVAAGERGARALTKSLVAQAPLEAPRELEAHVVEDGVALAWRGARPKEVAPPPLPTRPGLPALARAPRPAGAPDAPASNATPGSGTPAAGAAEAQEEEAEPKKRRNGFVVYRRRADSVYGVPLAAEPLELRHFKDAGAPRGVRVCYVVRGVASPDPLIESGPSNEACVVPRDISPPAAPAGLVTMPREGGLELIWSPSGEADLAGYRVLRAAAADQPEKLAELGPGQTSYLDAGAQRGVRYSYTVVAFDRTGNQSEPSAPVAAQLP